MEMKNRGVVPKNMFPALLREAIESMGDRPRDKIIVGFKATGPIPLDRQAVLKRLPRQGQNTDTSPSWCRALIEKLEESRRNDTPPTSARGRRKRLDVTPGQSVTAAGRRSPPPTEEVNLQTVMAEDESEPEENADSDDESNSHYDEEEEDNDCAEISDVDDPEPKVDPVEGDFILVNFVTREDSRDKYYVGKVENVLNSGTGTDIGNVEYEVRFLRKKDGKKDLWFSYPDIPDIECIIAESLVANLNHEKLRREWFVFPGLERLVNIKNVY